jgi:inorganic triphosphatase YgiF
METELKLLVNQQACEQLQQHPLLKKYAVSEPHIEHISDTYFDTPDLDLRQHDANLRVRHLDNTWVQTLKAGDLSTIGGLYKRHEWESTVSGPQPDLASLRVLIHKKTPWSSLLRSKSLEQKLKPIFTSEVARTVWNLRLPSGDEIESALDLGRLECNGQTAAISEFELELKSGQLVHLVDFAIDLQRDISLLIASASKAERGYALLLLRPTAAVKATPLHLSPKMTAAQAFAEIASNCLAQIKANQLGALQGGDVESLHQLRIGLLRLRSLIKIFRDQLPTSQSLQQELAWLSSQLSKARDWDVLAGSTLPELIRQLPSEISLSALQRAAEEKSHQLHQNLSSITAEPRYTKLFLGLTRLLQEGSLLQQTDKQCRLTSLSRKLLARGRRRIQRRSTFQEADQKARHRLRAAVKTARYECEFFQSLCKRRQSRSYLKALTALQEALGRQNDAFIAGKLLQELGRELGRELGTELGKQPNKCAGSAEFVRGYLLAQAVSEEKLMRQVWKIFSKRKIPGRSK